MDRNSFSQVNIGRSYRATRLVSTEGWEAMPGHEYLVTVTFEDEDGKTKMTSHLLYQNGADRDGHLQSGMEAGMQESYVRLDEHLATMQ